MLGACTIAAFWHDLCGATEQHSYLRLCCRAVQLRNVALNTRADGKVSNTEKAGNAARRNPRIIEDTTTYHISDA